MSAQRQTECITSTWQFQRLQQRRDWLDARQKAKASIGWDNQYDIEERDALSWALEELTKRKAVMKTNTMKLVLAVIAVGLVSFPAATMARTDTRLPLDANGHPVQILPIEHSHVLAPTEATAARNSDAIEAEVVTVIGNAAFYWAQGDVSVTATSADGWWPANEPLVLEIGTDSHISILRQDGTGAMIARVYEHS